MKIVSPKIHPTRELCPGFWLISQQSDTWHEWVSSAKIVDQYDTKGFCLYVLHPINLSGIDARQQQICDTLFQTWGVRPPVYLPPIGH